MKRIILIYLILFTFILKIKAESNDNKALSARAIFTTGLTERNEPVAVLKDVLVKGERIYVYVTNQREISINAERICVYIQFGSIPKVKHDYICKTYDGAGRLLQSNNRSFKPEEEEWNIWTWYNIKKDVDKPGNWKFEISLDNKQVLEEYLVVKEEKPSKSCLWRIKTGNNSVYLLGSIHMLKKEVYPLNESIEKAFEDSRLLAFEIDFDNEDNKETQKSIAKKGTLSKESTLEKSLNKETYRFVKEVLKKSNLDISHFNQYKPWYLGIILSDIRYEALGFKGKYGIDNYFNTKAKETGREVLGLETLEDRSNILDDMPIEYQELYIYGALLGDKYLMENELDAVQIAWQSGDIDKMEDIVMRDYKNDPEYYNALIVKRNNMWMPKIRSLLKENRNSMIIVGAAHLIGENGIIEVLKKEGYVIEQL